MADRANLDDAIILGPPADVGPASFLTTGCTLLNLAASGRGEQGGFARGRVSNVVGDGGSGKTLVALETSAYAYHKNELVVYDNAEEVMDFDVEAMYNMPPDDIFLLNPSQTVEEFGRSFVKAVSDAKGKPLLYVLDTLDAVGSSEERKRLLKSIETGKEQEDSYNLERQKYMNTFFREYIVNNMADNVHLCIISQIRAKIGVTFGKKHYRTGGKALDFYTHQVVWLREKGKLKRTVKGYERAYGILVEARFERNKVAKPFRDVQFQIIFDYGIDDIGSMIDWYCGSGRNIEYQDKKFTRASLIAAIEDDGGERYLREQVEQRWWEIEDSFKPDRKGKFHG